MSNIRWGLDGLCESRSGKSLIKPYSLSRLCRRLPHRRSPRSIQDSLDLKKTPQSRTSRDSISLRLGHATALTVHRTVIHYRVDTALPKGATRDVSTGFTARCGHRALRFVIWVPHRRMRRPHRAVEFAQTFLASLAGKVLSGVKRRG